MSRSPAAPNRPALPPKWIAVIVILGLGYLLLRPFLVERFGWDLPGLTEAKPGKDGTASGDATAQNAAARKERAARNRPVEVPTVPEQSEPEVPEEQPVGADTPAAPEDEPQKTNPPPSDRIAEKPRTQVPTSRSRADEPEPKTAPAANSGPPTASKGGTGKQPPANPPKSSNPAPEQPQFGTLTKIGGGALQSTAGLIYRQERSGNRLDHVLEHSRDIPSKPVHGVFDGNRDQILAWIDEAYMIAQKRGPPQVVTEDQGDRTTITVNLNRKIGYMGGENGARRGHPPLKMIKLVLEDRDVITAYPSNN